MGLEGDKRMGLGRMGVLLLYCMDMTSAIGVALIVSAVLNVFLLLMFLGQRRIITTDMLTGLLNKVGLMEARSRYLRRKNNNTFWFFDRRKRNHPPGGAVVYIDLDKFKAVNDRYGHHVGDMLIVEFSKFLKQQTRSHDILARLHGDEFVVILHEVTEGEARKIAAKIVETLATHTFMVHGHDLKLEATAGIAVMHHGEAFDVDTLIERADHEMLKAKKGNHVEQPSLPV